LQAHFSSDQKADEKLVDVLSLHSRTLFGNCSQVADNFFVHLSQAYFNGLGGATHNGFFRFGDGTHDEKRLWQKAREAYAYRRLAASGSWL
jgi:hypothetical protein